MNIAPFVLFCICNNFSSFLKDASADKADPPNKSEIQLNKSGAKLTLGDESNPDEAGFAQWKTAPDVACANGRVKTLLLLLNDFFQRTAIRHASVRN